jgi:mRNA-degrading endonuclease RelE of RelBE toxin-antitoxin system
MSYKIKSIPSFSRELKGLSKKYPSIKKEYEVLLDDLEENPFLGVPLGKDCYKIRMAIASKNKGKSGGARVITCVKVLKETVYLLAIFDKNDLENLSDAELLERLNQIELA